MSIGLYDDNTFTSLVSGQTLKSRSIDSGITNLDTVLIANGLVSSESSPGNVLAGTLKDIEIWDGVTSVSGNPSYTIGDVKTNIIEATGQTISTSTPSHIQFNRGTSNDWSIYLDGTSVATNTDSTSLGTISGTASQS